jgi:hypothetical protein
MYPDDCTTQSSGDKDMLGTLDLDEAAQNAAGNWQRFNSFVWFREQELDDANHWAVIYTQNRDSRLLAQSNSSVIAKTLERFTEGDDPDVVFESHNHWAVGHVDGFSIRVFRNGNITEAFKIYHELAERLEEYPILDESDYSQREYEATLENIKAAAWRLKSDFDLPDQWVGQVYDWLSDRRPNDIESRDDQGGYPSEDALKAAFEALNFNTTE